MDIQTIIKAVKNCGGIYHRDVVVVNDCARVLEEMTEGYLLVPKEPTAEMIEALYGPLLSISANTSRAEAYKAMLNASTKEEES
ncbi:MAG: hypothetical protein IIB44_07895 [Candidatus Marinimicrobia bacterium]|nr:hypothetical protein [Candidatus Neomarinimicrobiota bacterium]